MINYARDHSVADALNYIATWQTGMFQPGDMMETFAAKAEKRAPRLPGPAPRARARCKAVRGRLQRVSPLPDSSVARAASSRATGTRNGEQDT